MSRRGSSSSEEYEEYEPPVDHEVEKVLRERVRKGKVSNKFSVIFFMNCVHVLSMIIRYQ